MPRNCKTRPLADAPFTPALPTRTTADYTVVLIGPGGVVEEVQIPIEVVEGPQYPAGCHAKLSLDWGGESRLLRTLSNLINEAALDAVARATETD